MSIRRPAARRSDRYRLATVVLAAFFVLLASARNGVPGAVIAQDEPPEAETQAPTPTGTRRPTRTPQASATPTTTPLPAGALRMVLALDPAPREAEIASVSVGDAFEARVRLSNIDTRPAHDLTLEITLPEALLADDARTARGEINRTDDVIRWFLPILEPASEVSLSVYGVAGSEAAGLRGQPMCVLLLSRGAPIEHCLEIRVGPGGSFPGGEGGPDQGAFIPLPTAATGLGLADVLAEAPSVLAGWGLLALGLGVLGLWAGISMRGRDVRTTAVGAAVETDPPTQQTDPRG